MSSSEIRRAVASKKSDEIVALTSGPLRPLFSNEALVKVSAISLNRGELRRAERAGDGALQIGWDFSGTVDKTAADGSGPLTGTRVVSFSTRMEGWAEYVAVPTSYLAPIPDGVSDAQAATLPVAGLTALHSVDAATALLGRKALVTGASGGVGAFALQLAALAGGCSRTDSARRATAVHRKSRRFFGRGYVERCGGRIRWRLSFDYRRCQRVDFLANAISALAPDGVCVCYGVTDTPEIPVDIGQFMRIGLAQILGFHLYARKAIQHPVTISRGYSLLSRRGV